MYNTKNIRIRQESTRRNRKNDRIREKIMEDKNFIITEENVGKYCEKISNEDR